MADEPSPRAPRIRVVHLVIDLGVGGLERVVLDQIRRADRSQIEPGVLCLAGEGRLAPAARALGVPVRALAVHGRLVTAVRRLVWELRSWRPDVLHTHDASPHLLGAPAGRLARVPVVVHTRHCQTTSLSFRQALGMRLASALSNVVVAVSEDSASILRRSEHVVPSKSPVIRNGVDLAAFAPGNRWARVPGQRVISVGRLVAVKDFAMLLHAAARLADALPNFQLDIVGDGPERRALEALRTSLGLETRVHLLGERDDVARLLSGADVFALTSTSEGLSMSILEAIASGLPVVATAVGGNSEILIDGTAGLLVPPGNPASLASALLSVLEDPTRLASMGRAARKHAERHFDLRDVVARYESLYRDQLAVARSWLSHHEDS
jgi:glycosyltransferase involved in cell wall biosynthesis